MPSQDDLIQQNREQMRLRAEARQRGEIPQRQVPLSRSQARRRIAQLEAEINRLRDVPSDTERLRSELASVRTAHTSLLAERDALQTVLETTRAERDQAHNDLATLRKSIVPPNA